MSHELFPEVRVTEINRAATGEFVIPEDQPSFDLGGRFDPRAHSLEVRLEFLLNKLKGQADRFFVLEWTGNKVPRGVELMGRQIAWTQHGVVMDTRGLTMGYYDRLVEFGGEDRRLQQMLVYMSELQDPEA